jgi:hypothetical protein
LRVVARWHQLSGEARGARERAAAGAPAAPSRSEGQAGARERGPGAAPRPSRRPMDGRPRPGGAAPLPGAESARPRARRKTSLGRARLRRRATPRAGSARARRASCIPVQTFPTGRIRSKR